MFSRCRTQKESLLHWRVLATSNEVFAVSGPWRVVEVLSFHLSRGRNTRNAFHTSRASPSFSSYSACVSKMQELWWTRKGALANWWDFHQSPPRLTYWRESLPDTRFSHGRRGWRASAPSEPSAPPALPPGVLRLAGNHSYWKSARFWCWALKYFFFNEWKYHLLY